MNQDNNQLEPDDVGPGRIKRFGSFIWNFVKIIPKLPKLLILYIIEHAPKGPLNKWTYTLIASVGITALIVSAMIEFQVMVNMYDSSKKILSVPFQVIKFIWTVIVGGLWDGITSALDYLGIINKISKQDDGQQAKYSFLFPLITVAVFEGAKCGLILFRHSITKDMFEQMSWRHTITITRYALFFMSAFCSFVFFAQLMNKSNEVDINAKIKVRITNLEETKKQAADVEISRDREIEFWNELINSNNKFIDDAIRNLQFSELGDGGEGRVSKAKKAAINEQKPKNDAENVGYLKKITEKELEIRTKYKVSKEEKTNIENEVRNEQIKEDPPWMSTSIGALHQLFIPSKRGLYSRSFAILFMCIFSIFVSIIIELVISQMFKIVGLQISLARDSE